MFSAIRSTATKSVLRAPVSRQALRKNHHLPPYANEPAFPHPDIEAGKAFRAHLEEVEHHAEGTSGLWKKISFLIALPAIGLTAVNTYFVEKEHAHHRAEDAKIPDEERPKELEFQNIRNKDFFWGDGDKTLFWNPACNRHIKN